LSDLGGAAFQNNLKRRPPRLPGEFQQVHPDFGAAVRAALKAPAAVKHAAE
jgi:hypothetical protein